MAIVQAIASQQIRDNLGVTVSMPVYVEFDDGATIADIVAFIQPLISATDGVTDGVILKAGVELAIDLPGGIKTTPNATAEAERNGVFNFLQDSIKYRFGVAVPALKTSVIVSGKINLAAAAVVTFVNLLKNTGSVGVPEFTSTAYNALTALSDAFISFRKHRKAEYRRSVETP